MRSVRETPSSETAAVDAGASDADRTARARIRDAAIAGFARDGVAGTSVRTIARAADVSPGLVIHHFGSKDALRAACDQYVTDWVRRGKSAAMSAGPGLDVLGAMRDAQGGPPVLHYLARTLAESSPHVARLVDELVEDAVVYMQQGVETGVLTPAEDLRGRAAVLTIWSLGALVLYEHAERLLGADLFSDDPAGALTYMRAALEVIGAGVMSPEAYAQARQQLREKEDQEGKS